MRRLLVLTCVVSCSCAAPPPSRGPAPPDCGLGVEILVVRRGEPPRGAPAVFHLSPRGPTRGRMVVSPDPPRDQGEEVVGEVAFSFDGTRARGTVAFAWRERGAAWPPLGPPRAVDVTAGEVALLPVSGDATLLARLRVGRLRPCGDVCWARHCLPGLE